MTEQQYERWKDFSRRFVRHGFPRLNGTRRALVRHWVERFFAWVDEDRSWRHWRSWDNSAPGADYVCDCFSEFCQDLPGYWTERVERLYLDGKWWLSSALACALRAGIDVAAEPSAGVLGWRVGDVRRMYGGQIPDWLNEAYEGTLATAGDEEGILL